MKLQISDVSDLSIDLPALLKTRLLIQANSGGGKSYLLRRLAEQMFGKVQVIIIDPEGEFSTLREKFDYVLVGKGGETPADCRSAGLVAHKLLELHASAVCDLYEMKPQERHRWVKLFIDALIDSPKQLWHPVVIIVDEAHVFCPENKAGESEASGAMIDLATRGRKRGFCAIYATQRLGKLKKDAAAELTNVLIGQTFIDIDRDRAADCLGVSGKERHTFDDEIKTIEQGNFYALGRAICTTRTKVLVGKVQTTHPEIGGKKFSSEPPPPSEKVKLMMPKLADLPKAAEDKAKNEAELRGEIRSLKAQVKELQSTKPEPADAGKIRAIKSELSKTMKALSEAMKFIVEITTRNFGESVPSEEIKTAIGSAVNSAMKQVESKFDARKKEMAALKQTAERVLDRIKKLSSEPVSVAIEVKHNEPFTVATSAQPRRFQPVRQPAPVTNGDVSIGKCERAILTALAQYPQGRTAVQVALLAQYSVNSGGFNNSLGKLRSSGLITRGTPIQITDEGRGILGDFQELPTGRDLAQHWINSLGKCEASILTALVNAHPDALTSEQVAEQTGYSRDSGGFNNALGRLRTLELITRGQPMKASDDFFQ